MDDFFDALEGDELQSGDVTPSVRSPPCSPLKDHNPVSSATSSQSSSASSKNLTFTDVFGSPDKRDVKELGLSQQKPSSTVRTAAKKVDLSSSLPLSSSSSPSSSSFLSRSQLDLHKTIREDKNVPYKADTAPVILDPYSRVRILKSSISIFYDESMTPEAALRDRNLGLEFVSLTTFASWYRGKGKNQKNFWISGVLVGKTPGIRKSAKGNDYSIWEMSDLRDLDKKVTVFLFGNASNTLSATPLGTLVDVTTPGVMADAEGTLKFSASNTTQVRFIGNSKDFGFCGAVKKNGNKCTAVVNKWECSFCVYHASSELKKLNMSGGKGKSKHRQPFGFTPLGSGDKSLKDQGVTISEFQGRPGGGNGLSRSFGGSSSQVKLTTRPNLPQSNRMVLQSGVNTMSRNQIKSGNPDTIKFIPKGSEQHHLLKTEGAPPPVERKPLDLNPTKTRHLTDKDRDLLSKLESQSISATPPPTAEPEKKAKSKQSKESSSSQGPVKVNEMITSSIVSNPNAASRNFMQFLSLQHAPRDQVDLTSSQKTATIQPMVMSRAKVQSMEKALDFVKKNGPIKKVDPNAVLSKKRKSTGSAEPSDSNKRSKSSKIDVEFDFDNVDPEEFKKILNAKSAHDDELDAIQHEEYFGKLEKKEALENKLLNTFSLETNAFMCRHCKYVALSQGEFCKDQGHQVRMVKARKRFFKCKDCGNRTMSLDRLPKRPCSNCNNSSWLVAPVGKERKGPMLPSEMLAVRGHEEKFVGSAASKMFLHLEV